MSKMIQSVPILLRIIIRFSSDGETESFWIAVNRYKLTKSARVQGSSHPLCFLHIVWPLLRPREATGLLELFTWLAAKPTCESFATLIS